MTFLTSIALAAALTADPCTVAGRPAFAGKVMDALSRDPALAGGLRYDAEAFQVHVERKGEKTCTLNLENVAKEYCESAEADRAGVLARFARVASEGCGKDSTLPKTYEAARPRLLPVVRSRLYLQQAVSGGRPAGVPFAEHLFVGVAVDSPESLQIVDVEALETWKVSWETALADAVANLRALSDDPFRQVSPGLWAGPWSDSYAASRVLLTAKLRSLVKKGDVVVSMPNRDTILVCSADDAAALEALAAATEREAQRARPLSLLPVRISEGGTAEVFSPPAGHPARRAMRRLIALEVQWIYDEEGETLEAANGKAGLDVFVAHARVIDRKDLEPISVSVLTRGVQTLLPRTDVVVFVDLDVEPKVRAVVPFEDALRALGPRAVLRAGYPPRWMVTDLPSTEELARLPRVPGF